MKHYELTYLISPDLLEKEAIELSEKIGSFIQEQGGTLGSNKKPVKKRLGQPIKNKTLAYFGIWNFHLEPEKLGALKKTLEEKQKILRYLLSKTPIKKILKEKKLERRRNGIITSDFAQKSIKLSKPAPAPAAKEQKKVELKEIEKKLDEILE